VLDVLLTVDVEVWCDGWADLDRKFPDAFRRYVYGTTSSGDYGLPYHVATLRSYGLTGVFFVEPLFSTRFGPGPLREVVEIVASGSHEVQLHLHTEWVDEAREPLLGAVLPDGKRQHMLHFDLDEQAELIRIGARLLREAGAGTVQAFRAGSFACNRDTLTAVARNGIPFDSSYNASMLADRNILPNDAAVEPFFANGVLEYPMTVFREQGGRLRHVQITACSYGEMETLLWRALESGRSSFVLLSHNFELMNKAKTKVDWIAVRRFNQLCEFLGKHRDCFNVTGFNGLAPRSTSGQPDILTMPAWKTSRRIVEQLLRRAYQ